MTRLSRNRMEHTKTQNLIKKIFLEEVVKFRKLAKYIS